MTHSRRSERKKCCRSAAPVVHGILSHGIMSDLHLHIFPWISVRAFHPSHDPRPEQESRDQQQEQRRSFVALLHLKSEAASFSITHPHTHCTRRLFPARKQELVCTRTSSILSHPSSRAKEPLCMRSTRERMDKKHDKRNTSLYFWKERQRKAPLLSHLES